MVALHAREEQHVTDVIECAECGTYFVATKDAIYCPHCIEIKASRWKINDQSVPFRKDWNWRAGYKKPKKSEYYLKRKMKRTPSANPGFDELSGVLHPGEFSEWQDERDYFSFYRLIEDSYREHLNNAA